MEANMNMPDPQAMAAAWMAQFSDPAAWQPWMKPPVIDGGQLATILSDAGAGIKPAALEAIKNDYLHKVSALWQDFLASKTPELKDRRFSAPEWQANPLSAFNAASYLLNAE